MTERVLKGIKEYQPTNPTHLHFMLNVFEGVEVSLVEVRKSFEELYQQGKITQDETNAINYKII
jgi:hypothetical protein